MPWKPGARMPGATVLTVTVTYPPVKSKVAVATDLPSGVFSSAVSDPAPGAELTDGAPVVAAGEPLRTGGVVPG